MRPGHLPNKPFCTVRAQQMQKNRSVPSKGKAGKTTNSALRPTARRAQFGAWACRTLNPRPALIHAVAWPGAGQADGKVQRGRTPRPPQIRPLAELGWRLQHVLRSLLGPDSVASVGLRGPSATGLTAKKCQRDVQSQICLSEKSPRIVKNLRPFDTCELRVDVI